MSNIELIASIFGLLSIGLTVKNKVWCWPAGMVQVALYCFIFFNVKLYSQAALQIFFLGSQIYGWYSWLHGGEEKNELQISRLNNKFNFILIALGIVLSLAIGFITFKTTDGSLPFPDAFIVVFSVIAQILLTRKKLENWYLWIFVNSLSIVVYLYESLFYTVVLYLVMLLLSIMGFIEWKKIVKNPKIDLIAE